MKHALFIIAWLVATPVLSQKQDYIWVNGHDSFSSNPNFGGVTIDFNSDTLSIRKEDRFVDFGKAICASICDTAGHLLFYTNGCVLANADNALMENGDSLNAGDIFNSFCGDETLGYPSGFQSAIVLPKPGSPNVYYLFHKRIFNTYNPFDVHSHFLLYSVIDMSPNNGQGKVIAKNEIAYQDTLAFGDMTAVRHANGADWWLLSPGRRNNKYFVFLFDASGLHLQHSLAMGAATPPAGEGAGQVLFSPDGSKYIRFNPKNKIRMFDFDRSTGMLSNYQAINVDFGAYDPFDGGCSISPSGQYLYISVKRYMYQMDLWATDIEASQVLVGEYDGYGDPLAANFGRGIMGPDCKLYMFPGNDTKAIHVIHHPNEPGLACGFEQHALLTPTYHGATFPNFPNFRLGPLGAPISPCAGYTVGSPEAPSSPLPAVSVFPNPASRYVQLVANTSLPSGSQWVLYDAFGRVQRRAALPAPDSSTDLDIQALPPGVYFWEAHSGAGALIRGGKLLKR